MLSEIAAALLRHEVTFDPGPVAVAQGYHAKCRDCGALFRTVEEWLDARCPEAK